MLKGKVLYDTVVLTTNRHEEKKIITLDNNDVGNHSGQIKDRQTVVLVGDMVKDINIGDEILINQSMINVDDKGIDKNIVMVPFGDDLYLFVPRRYILYVFGKDE